MTIADTLSCLNSPGWMQQAVCRSTDPEVFYANEDTGRFQKMEIKRAVKICQHCPVMVQCLTWALEVEDFHAILGGTTPAQRVKLLGKTCERPSRAALCLRFPRISSSSLAGHANAASGWQSRNA